MKIQLLIVQIIFALLNEGITYQTGTFSLSNNNGCAQLNTIYFKEPFVNIPQVITFFTHYDFLPTFGPLFSHTGITTTKFDVSFICSNSGISEIQFMWIAVDDDRFEFISRFNIDVSNDLSKTFFIPHANVNHVQMLFGFTNFNFIGTFNINLDVQMTSTDITVTFTQTSLSILSMGFFVILGTNDAFNLGPWKTLTHVTVSDEAHYTNLPILYNSQLIITFTAISYLIPTYLDTLRIRAFQQPNTNQTISYAVASWYICIVQSITFQEIIVPTNNYILQPTFVKKLRCAKKYEQNADIYPVKLRVIEYANKVFINTQTFTLNSIYQQTTMIISMQCQRSTFIKGQFLKCFGCSEQYQNYNQQCYATINLMEFHIILYQQDQVEQKFQVDITSTTIKVTHLVQNTVGDVPYVTIDLSLNEV